MALNIWQEQNRRHLFICFMNNFAPEMERRLELSWNLSVLPQSIQFGCVSQLTVIYQAILAKCVHLLSTKLFILSDNNIAKCSINFIGRAPKVSSNEFNSIKLNYFHQMRNEEKFWSGPNSMLKVLSNQSYEGKRCSGWNICACDSLIVPVTQFDHLMINDLKFA